MSSLFKTVRAIKPVSATSTIISPLPVRPIYSHFITANAISLNAVKLAIATPSVKVTAKLKPFVTVRGFANVMSNSSK